MSEQIQVICKRCAGSGKYLEYGQCFKCGGSGVLMMSKCSAKEWGYESVESFRAGRKAQAEQVKADEIAKVESLADMAIQSINQIAHLIGFTGEVNRSEVIKIAHEVKNTPHADRSNSGYAGRIAAAYVKSRQG